MPDNGDRRGGRWSACIAALLVERTLGDAAKRAGVGVSSLRRYMNDPKFLKLYRRARRQVVESAIAQIQQATGEAVVCLRRNLSSGAPSAEVRAALSLIGLAVDGVEQIDIEERMTDVEEQLAAEKHAKGEPFDQRRERGPWRAGE